MSADEKTRVAAPPEPVAVGTQLSGIYELDQRLASGGMGEVYKGHNIQTNDPVAIKIVLPEFARDQQILSLFRKEAAILNSLYHEAIVRYHVFAIDQQIGRPYLAMEYVDGVSLVDVMKKGPLAPETTWRLLARLAAGLAAAHELGVIHRDLSPDNIVLPGRKVERAKIIDFGIAKSAGVGGETLIGGAFAGKYNYVSPEQLGMAGGEITGRSDMYSLALVIAAVSRGEPYNMSGSQVAVIDKRRVVPDMSRVDPDIAPILTAMLQPDPNDRPNDMGEIAEWTRQLIDSKRSAAAPQGASVQRYNPGPNEPTGRPGVAWPQTTPPPALAWPQSQPPQPPDGRSQPPSQTWEQPPPQPPSWQRPPQSTAPPAQQSSPPRPSESPFGPYTGPSVFVPQDRGGSSLPADPSFLPPPRKGSRTPLIAGALIVLLSAGGAGAFYGGLLDGLLGRTVAPATEKKADAPIADKTEPNPQPQPPPQKVATDPLQPGETKVATKTEVAPIKTAPNVIKPVVSGPKPADTPVKTESDTAQPKPADPGPTAEATKTEVPAKLPDAPAKSPDEIAKAPDAGTTQKAVTNDDSTQIGPDGIVTRRPSWTTKDQTETSGQDEVAMNVPDKPGKPDIGAVDEMAQRIAWLHDYTGGTCFFTTATSMSADKIEIEGFGDKVDSFQELLAAFKAKFGVEPDIGVRLIRQKQCPITTFMQGFAHSKADAPDLSLVKYDLNDRDPMSGQVQIEAAQETYLLLVDHDGIAHNLDAILQRSGDTATFNISLGLGTARGSDKSAVPQVLIAFSSTQKVTAMDGVSSAPAADLLPKISAELDTKKIIGAASARYFRIRG